MHPTIAKISVAPTFKISISDFSFPVVSSIINSNHPFSSEKCLDGNVFTPSKVALINLLKLLENDQDNFIHYTKAIESAMIPTEMKIRKWINDNIVL